MSRATDIYSGDSLRLTYLIKRRELAALRISTVEFTVDSVMMGRVGSVERRRLRDGKESFGPEVNGQGLKGQRGMWSLHPHGYGTGAGRVPEGRSDILLSVRSRSTFSARFKPLCNQSFCSSLATTIFLHHRPHCHAGRRTRPRISVEMMQELTYCTIRDSCDWPIPYCRSKPSKRFSAENGGVW
jgi:hypothetical protein